MDLIKHSTWEIWKKKCSFLMKKVFLFCKKFPTCPKRELFEEVFCLLSVELWGRLGWRRFGRWLWTQQDHTKRCHRTVSGFFDRTQEYNFRDQNYCIRKKLSLGMNKSLDQTTSFFWKNRNLSLFIEGELDYMTFKGLFQTKRFYDSMKHTDGPFLHID